MGIFHFLLAGYFTLVLGIAGIAKINNLEYFYSTLHFQYNISEQSSKWIGKIFPWIEITIAILLQVTTSIYHTITVIIIILLFLMFLLLAIMLNSTKNTNDCGCYGKILKKKGLTANPSTITIQLSLSILLLFLTVWSKPLASSYHISGTVLFSGIFGWLLWRTCQRHEYGKRY